MAVLSLQAIDKGRLIIISTGFHAEVDVELTVEPRRRRNVKLQISSTYSNMWYSSRITWTRNVYKKYGCQ